VLFVERSLFGGMADGVTSFSHDPATLILGVSKGSTPAYPNPSQIAMKREEGAAMRGNDGLLLIERLLPNTTKSTNTKMMF